VSPPNLTNQNPGGPRRKPQADIYTVLLGIALFAVILAIIFLFLEVADYGPNKYKGAPPVVSASPAVEYLLTKTREAASGCLFPTDMHGCSNNSSVTSVPIWRSTWERPTRS
jgi:hypothetical protein